METLSELIMWIRGIAPEVWAIYVQRQYVVAVTDLVWVVVCIGLVIVSIHAVRGSLIRIDEDEATYDKKERWGFVLAVGVVIGLVSAILAPILLTNGIMRLLTPEYCAIQDLLSNLP